MSKKYVSVNKNSTKSAYHTNPNCKTLKGNYRPVSEHEIEWHELEECEWCADEN